MNKPNVINVSFISEWEEGDIETSAKLDITTGRVFDIDASDRGAEYEHLVREFVRFKGDWVDYPVKLRNDEDYAVVNKILLDRIQRMAALEISGELVSQENFEIRFENSSIKPSAKVRVVATNEIFSAKDLYARFTADAGACIKRRIKRLALESGLSRYLLDVSEDPESQLIALKENDREALKAIGESIGLGNMVNEAYLGYSNDELTEMILFSVERAKENLASMANLSRRLQKDRVLVVVERGMAEVIADPGVDSYVFDKDAYDSGIPERFSDLANRYPTKLPIEGREFPKRVKMK